MPTPATEPVSEPTPDPASGRVVSIHLAKARRLPMRAHEQVEAEAGVGLVGDRYHGSRHRHVTVQTEEDLAAASSVFGQEIDPGLTRRNVTVSGIVLPTRPGERLRIGDVDLEVVRIAAPCRLLDDGIGPGAARAMHARGGTVFRLLSSGTLSVGDAVVSVETVDAVDSVGGPS